MDCITTTRVVLVIFGVITSIALIIEYQVGLGQFNSKLSDEPSSDVTIWPTALFWGLVAPLILIQCLNAYWIARVVENHCGPKTLFGLFLRIAVIVFGLLIRILVVMDMESVPSTPDEHSEASQAVLARAGGDQAVYEDAVSGMQVTGLHVLYTALVISALGLVDLILRIVAARMKKRAEREGKNSKWVNGAPEHQGDVKFDDMA